MFKIGVALMLCLVINAGRSMANTNHGDHSHIYKILLPAEWAEFNAQGKFLGNATDRKDGFIHFSARDQVDWVLDSFYKNTDTVYIVEFKAVTFGAHLKWERASTGEFFPHVHGMALKRSDVTHFEVRNLETP